MVALGGLSATDSQKVETGEIDTGAPFQTIRGAVGHFGEGSFPAGKPAKPNSPEGVLADETKLRLAQNVLNKLKGQLENAHTTKSRALKDLERAKRTVEELTHELKNVVGTKNSAIKATEAAKSRARHIEETNSGDLSGTIEDLESAKQELRKARQDRDASLESKSAALDRAEEAQRAVKVNMEKVEKLTKEISAVRESTEKLKLASLEVQQEQAKTFAEKDTQRQSYKAKLEESAKRLLALKNEYDHDLAKKIEAELFETVNQIADSRKQLEDAKASDLESVQAVTSKLDDAKGTLRKVIDEENSLRSSVESLKIELENTKKECLELKEKEAKTESIVGNLHVKLWKSKYELEAFLAKESKTRSAYEEMISTLQKLSVETENARREAEEMKKETKKLKSEAEASRIALEEADKQLTVALEEAEAAKEAETRALDQIKMLCDKTHEHASTSKSGTDINISRKEVEYLRHKVEESNNVAEMKVAAAVARVEAVKASENEALMRFKAIEKEIEDMKIATADALKKAEMAEAAKKAVEGELRRWHEREQKKAVEVAAPILAEPSPPPQCKIQQQNPPDIIVQVQELEKSKSVSKMAELEKSKYPVSKKALLRNFSDIFKRRNNQIESGSASYRPGSV